MTQILTDQKKFFPWRQLAQHFRHVGPPMRPAAQDLAYYWSAAQEWIQMRGAPRVLLLGVTPELYSLPWPKGTDFLAVDRTQAMIDLMWLGPKEAVQCADWLSLDLPNGSRDIVLCDGGFQLLKYPEEQKRLILELRRMLSDQGLCIFRFYALPAQQELPGAVLKDLLDGKIQDLNMLKIRLSMSLQRSLETGVELAQVYDAIGKAVPSLQKLAEKIGWPVDHMLAIEAYKDLHYPWYYLTVEQVMRLFCHDPGGFRIHRSFSPSYGMGECFPTFSLQCCSTEKAGDRS